MISLKFIIFALAFIASGGLLFAEVFKRQRSVRFAAATFAVVAFGLTARELTNVISIGESIAKAPSELRTAPDQPPGKNELILAKNVPSNPVKALAFVGNTSQLRLLLNDGKVGNLDVLAPALALVEVPSMASANRYLSGNGDVIIDVSEDEKKVDVLSISKRTRSTVRIPQKEVKEYTFTAAVSYLGDYLALGYSRSSDIQVDKDDHQNLHKGYIGRLLVVPLAKSGRPWSDSIWNSSLISKIQFSRNGDKLATANWNGRAFIFAINGEHVASFYASTLFLNGIGISSASHLVATSDYDKLRLWTSSRDHEGQFVAIKSCELIGFDPKDIALACAPKNGFVEVFDVGQAKRLATLSPQVAEPTSLAFSSDGGLLAVSDKKGQVVVWKALTGELLGVLNVLEKSDWVWIGGDAKYCGSTGVERFLRTQTKREGWLWDSYDVGLLSDSMREAHKGQCIVKIR